MKKDTLLIIILASLIGIISAVVMTDLNQSVASDKGKDIQIELISKDARGYMFHDKTAEFEPDILVSIEDVRAWDIEGLKVGDKVTGNFDSEGWELHGITIK